MSHVSKGLILAAGMGTRLNGPQDLPKPLVPVGGTPMIIRTINALRAGGCDEIGIVIGYKGDTVRAAVEGHAERQKMALRFIENKRWTEPNGLSLFLGQSFTGKSDFILSMVDHLFDPEIIRRLQRTRMKGGVTLAVDQDIKGVFDLEDATKVWTDQQLRILSIGKTITRFNGVDCGLFRCTAEIFPALELAFDQGELSISAGMQRLAASSRFFAMPVDGLFWQDMDTPEMVRQAEQTGWRVLQAC